MKEVSFKILKASRLGLLSIAHELAKELDNGHRREILLTREANLRNSKREIHQSAAKTLLMNPGWTNQRYAAVRTLQKKGTGRWIPMELTMQNLRVGGH